METHTSGLGHVLDYKAPGTICSIYVYDRGRYDIGDDVTDDVIQEEFEEAAQEIAIARPNFAAWPDPPKTQHCLQRWYYSIGDDGRQASLL
jgi:hypothetical protein